MSTCIQITCKSCKTKSIYTLDEKTDRIVCSSCGGVTILRLVPGFVYVLSNRGHRGQLYKVGYSERSVNERIQELNCQTSTPEPFTLEAAYPSDTPYEHEQQLHEALKAYRIPGKEYFRIEIGELLAKCSSVCKTSACMGRQYSPTPMRENPLDSEILQLQSKLKQLETLGKYQECMILARAFVKQRAPSSIVLKIKKRARFYEACVDKKLGPPAPKPKVEIISSRSASSTRSRNLGSSSRNAHSLTASRNPVQQVKSALPSQTVEPTNKGRPKDIPAIDSEKHQDSHHLARMKRAGVFSDKWRWENEHGRAEQE